MNNIGYINNSYANKPTFAYKNFEQEKYDDKLNSAVKIMDSNEEEQGKNCIMPYDINYLQKVAPRKKSNLTYMENNNNNYNNHIIEKCNFLNEEAVFQKVKYLFNLKE